MQITLLAAASKDGFIADAYGNGDFSSPEDKARFRSFLRSSECDCFICGRKTADEFQKRLTYKPVFVLTHSPDHTRADRTEVSSLEELRQKLTERGLNAPALLGGAQTYHFFLEADAVDRLILTEENLILGAGTRLETDKHLGRFRLTETCVLSPRTSVRTYIRKKP